MQRSRPAVLAMIPDWCATAMSGAALVARGERTRDEEREVLRRTGAVLAEDPAGFGAAFYARLFAHRPELRLLFPPGEELCGGEVAALLAALLQCLDRPHDAGRLLEDVGRRCRTYGARFTHYLAAGEALIETLAERNGASFDEGARLAWARLVSWIVYRMRHAATEPRREGTPAARAADGALRAGTITARLR